MEIKKPNYIGIGAQKAGTTWLHQRLKQHPQVSLPPLKELHYFDMLEYGISGNVIHRITRKHWLNDTWKVAFRNRMLHDLRTFNLRTIPWNIRYFFGKKGTKWYSRLFPHDRDTVTGEICPSYSTLSVKTIRHIHNILPHVKIIFLLRNPVERAWSGCKMVLASISSRKFEEVSEDEIMDFLKSEGNLLRTDYRRTIENWSSVFPDNQLFIGFIEEIQSDPGNLLNKIYNFLEIDNNTYEEVESSDTVVNKGIDTTIPAKYEQLLSTQYLPQLKYLASYFESYENNYPAQWLKRAQEVVRDQ